MTKLDHVQITLVDRDKDLVDLFNTTFEDIPSIRAVCHDIRTYANKDGAALVSPAISGIDEVYAAMFGGWIQSSVQYLIRTYHLGEIPVGSTEWISFTHERHGYNGLIVAPTMDIPRDVSGTRNAYWAFRAILVCAIRKNIRRIVMPGLCTGIGSMSHTEMCLQTLEAWNSVSDYLTELV